jgi:hypothetical protein
MNQQTTDNQFLLDLRREFEEFRDEVRAALKKIDEDTDMIADHSMYVKSLGLKLGKYTNDHIKRIYDDVDILYDMAVPPEQKYLPQINKARDVIRADLANRRNEGSSENGEGRSPEDKGNRSSPEQGKDSSEE